MSERPSEDRPELLQGGGRPVEEVLEHSRMLRQMAGRVARIGGWSVEVPSHEVRWSPEMFEILEWDRVVEPTLDHGVNTVYRDPALIADAVATCAADGTAFDVEVEAVTFTGRPIWARVVGEPQYGADGAITRVVGALQDISVAKRAADERIEREQRLERIAAQEAAAADRLRELDRTKNAFLSAVSHELRTPLTVVQGMGRTLQRLGDQLGDGRAEVERAIVEHADRLATLLDDLLDVDRLTRGALSCRRQACDAGAVVRDALVGSPVADRLVLDLPDELPALVDTAQLERIVVNLVENAGKYAPTGPIEVELARLDTQGVAVEVRDHGPGIPPEQRERVFEPLYRADEAAPRPGTGVGLALVAAFARLHGGTACVLDREHGAHLRVELPGPDADDAAHDAAGDDDGQRATTVSTS
ncbi:MAG: ATP-binding protein [Nitriliruptoraceae bacterium]|nr:ATP-binding protein [Nitriliruptoraceae bacterium]